MSISTFESALLLITEKFLTICSAATNTPFPIPAFSVPHGKLRINTNRRWTAGHRRPDITLRKEIDQLADVLASSQGHTAKCWTL